MKHFAKIVNGYRYFHKTLYFRCLIGFWIRLFNPPVNIRLPRQILSNLYWRIIYFIISLSYRNQSIDLENKAVDWFLYYWDLCHEKVNRPSANRPLPIYIKFYVALCETYIVFCCNISWKRSFTFVQAIFYLDIVKLRHMTYQILVVFSFSTTVIFMKNTKYRKVRVLKGISLVLHCKW